MELPSPIILFQLSTLCIHFLNNCQMSPPYSATCKTKPKIPPTLVSPHITDNKAADCCSLVSNSDAARRGGEGEKAGICILKQGMQPSPFLGQLPSLPSGKQYGILLEQANKLRLEDQTPTPDPPSLPAAFPPRGMHAFSEMKKGL